MYHKPIVIEWKISGQRISADIIELILGSQRICDLKWSESTWVEIGDRIRTREAFLVAVVVGATIPFCCWEIVIR